MTAAHWPLVTTYLTVTIAPACQVTPVTDLPVQVRLIIINIIIIITPDGSTL